MSYEVFFAGVGGTVLGTLLGAWFAYRFQKQLLEQQLDFQRQQGEADAVQRAKIAEDELRMMSHLANTIHQVEQAASKISYALGGDTTKPFVELWLEKERMRDIERGGSR